MAGSTGCSNAVLEGAVSSLLKSTSRLSIYAHNSKKKLVEIKEEKNAISEIICENKPVKAHNSI